jgi:hypothetical protein
LVSGIGEFKGILDLIDEVLERRGGVPRCREACGGLHECLGSDLAELSKADVGEANVAVFEGAHVDGLDAVEQGGFERLVNVVVFSPFSQALGVHSDGE